MCDVWIATRQMPDCINLWIHSIWISHCMLLSTILILPLVHWSWRTQTDIIDLVNGLACAFTQVFVCIAVMVFSWRIINFSLWHTYCTHSTATVCYCRCWYTVHIYAYTGWKGPPICMCKKWQYAVSEVVCRGVWPWTNFDTGVMWLSCAKKLLFGLGSCMLISMETTLITLNLLASVVFMIISMTDLGRMLALSWYSSG